MLDITEHMERASRLKREGRLPELEALLLELVRDTEKEAREARLENAVGPWAYEQLAILYRKPLASG